MAMRVTNCKLFLLMLYL